MKDAFAGLEKSDAVRNIFMRAVDNPLLAVLAGTVITMIIQSSSAAIASIQLLAAQGVLGDNWEAALQVAIPFVLGSNIGTTITAQLAALGTNVNARRAAWAHTMFNVIGAFVCFWLMGWFVKLAHIITPQEPGAAGIMVSIAVAHTSIKLFEAALFLPLTGVLEKVVIWMNPDRRREAEARPVVLERHLLQTPEIAMDQARREIVRMTAVAKEAVNMAIAGLETDDRKKLNLARENEDITDNFQYEITSYLAMLSTKELSEELSTVLPVMLHTVNDLERIGDHAVNIAEIAERKIDQKIIFSESARGEIETVKSEVNEMFDRTSTALETMDKVSARLALINEGNLNRMQREFRRSHVQRMTEQICTPEGGLIFIDLVDNVEKIGDHLTNISQAVIGGLQWDGVEPKPLPPGM